MELRHLRYFLAVAENLNFTKAAAKLHLAQPSLTRQIHNLEEEIGVRLLDRSKSQVALTRIAHKVLMKGIPPSLASEIGVAGGVFQNE